MENMDKNEEEILKMEQGGSKMSGFVISVWRFCGSRKPMSHTNEGKAYPDVLGTQTTDIAVSFKTTTTSSQHKLTKVHCCFVVCGFKRVSSNAF